MNKTVKQRFRKFYFKVGFLLGAFLTFCLVMGWYFGKELAIESKQINSPQDATVIEPN